MAIGLLAIASRSIYGQAARPIPTPTYFGSFALLYAGEYRDALKGFGSERGIRTPQSRWIDSICYHTMTGECYYKLGQYGEALESYNAALNLYIAFSNWMTAVQFTAPVVPVTNRPAFPWGRSARNMPRGKFPDFPIAQGQPITEAAVRRGGVLASPVQRLINVTEIVRCTCLAMMRRAEILGPLAKHDRLTDKVLNAAAQRQGIPNHWSQAWLDAQLGFANVAAGNDGQAFALLQRSLAVGGEMDHPVTGLALLQLGKLSLDAGRLAEAAQMFEEASYTAAEHGDLTVLEEAFRHGSIVHAIARPKTVFAPLAPAAAWAAKRGGRDVARELQASLLIQGAQSAAEIGQTPAAVALLAQAKALVGRRTMALCAIGARLNYVGALTQYQAGNVAAGDESLAAALKIYKGFSPWLFQLALTSTELAKNNLSSRDARTIFERLGDDPTPADWVARPMDCLAVLSTPHHATYEQWFETVSERDLETRLEVAERARRHRFYTALPFGGRLLALRWLLEAPEELLDNAARLQRQDLQTRYPAYAELSKRAIALHAELRGLPLAPKAENGEDLRKQSELLAQLGKTAASQETILREIAVRREPANFVFPPIRSMKDIQAELPSGTVLLSVFAANRQLHAILLSKDKYANWAVERPDVLEKRISGLLRAMGNFDGARELQQSQLTEAAWQAPARELIDHFLKGSNLNFAQPFDELVVVPDGAVWYLPFEAVHVGDAKSSIPLIDKTRVRYAPTVGLAVAARRGRLESPEVAVVLSGQDAGQEPSVVENFITRLQAATPKATVLAGVAGPSPLYGLLADWIVVLSDLANQPQSPFEWSPLPLDRQRAAGSLANWLALPWKSTDVMVLPGFHTPGENALREGGAVRGHDLFLASCGLMATGARTIVLSRWRTGGQSSRELVRQFLQELPFSTASEAWQRAVQLVKESPLDVAYEPRVRGVPGGPPIDGGHPFFWAGYMVFDTGVVPHSKEAAPEEPPVLKLEPQAPKVDVPADQKEEVHAEEKAAAQENDAKLKSADGTGIGPD
jgi:tetratricopeptide (TPR) repeat protein